MKKEVVWEAGRKVSKDLKTPSVPSAPSAFHEWESEHSRCQRKWVAKATGWLNGKSTNVSKSDEIRQRASTGDGESRAWKVKVCHRSSSPFSSHSFPTSSSTFPAVSFPSSTPCSLCSPSARNRRKNRSLELALAECNWAIVLLRRWKDPNQ